MIMIIIIVVVVIVVVVVEVEVVVVVVVIVIVVVASTCKHWRAAEVHCSRLSRFNGCSLADTAKASRSTCGVYRLD